MKHLLQKKNESRKDVQGYFCITCGGYCTGTCQGGCGGYCGGTCKSYSS